MCGLMAETICAKGTFRMVQIFVIATALGAGFLLGWLVAPFENTLRTLPDQALIGVAVASFAIGYGLGRFAGRDE